MNKIIACDHVCSGNCRRVGCNCECGEFHQEATTINVQYDEGDRTAQDYADAEPVIVE